MSNIGLYKAFDAVGIDYEKTAVGDKYVYECMRENEYKHGKKWSLYWWGTIRTYHFL